MRRFAVYGIILFSLPSVLLAGGWNNTLIGTRAISLGGAFIAVADDPSAVFYNPAGILRQEGRFNVSFDGFYIWPSHVLTLPTGSIIHSRYTASLPQFFMTARLNDRVTFGFGVFTPYAGGGVDWKKADLGYPFRSTMGITSITPAVAYKVSEELSVGATLNFYTSTFTLDTDMAPLGPLSSEESGSALSAGFGLMFRPGERAAFGLSIRGPAKLTMAGKTKMNLAGYTVFFDSETSIKIPWDIEAGFSYRLSDRLLLSTSADYTLWSALDKVDKVIKGIPVVGDIRYAEPMDFRNILVLRAGLELALNPVLSLRGGVGFDKWASPVETLSPANIDVNKVVLLGGIGYRTGRMKIDFAYVYGIGDERTKETDVQGVSLIEKFNLNLQVAGLGVSYSF